MHLLARQLCELLQHLLGGVVLLQCMWHLATVEIASCVPTSNPTACHNTLLRRQEQLSFEATLGDHDAGHLAMLTHLYVLP